MRLKKLYGRFSRWYVFGKLHAEGIAIPVAHPDWDAGQVRVRLERVRLTTSTLEVAGTIDGEKTAGLHLSVHARAGAASLSAPARITWSDDPATGGARGLVQATLNVPPAAQGRLSLRLEMPDGSHRQHLIARYTQNDLARIMGGMERAFWVFLAREVLPRAPQFLFRKPRQKARRAISRTLDTQPFFAAGARHIDIAASFVAPARNAYSPARSDIDIIVPVFNGFDCLPEFFRRLARTTHEEKAHIWIIDDKSSDARVWPLVCEVASRDEFAGRTTLMRNERNLGFPGTVNRGLEAGRRDAIILNTDIRLPQCWFSRLTAPLSDSDVASATPFSNRATLASFPVIDRDNDLPLGLDADTIDQVFSEVDPLAWQLDLPTGVGFCMALSRRFIDRVGPFDAEAFGRGYGEENDWCQRAAAMGGRNVLVANLFVEHDHGASYPSEERKRLLARNLELLHRRHPRFHAEVAAFMAADPVLPLRAALFARLCASPAAGGIEVFIDHALGGGANWYREERIKALREKGRPSLVVSGQRKTRDLYATIEAGGTLMRLALASWDELDRLVPAGDHVRWIYNCAVGFAGAESVPGFLARRVKAMGNRVEVALHDYFAVCPSYNLLDDDGVFCGIPADPARCRACLAANPHRDAAIETADVVAWRRTWGELFALADAVMAFSHESARLIARAYPDAVSRISVRPHAHMETLRPVIPRPLGPALTVAVIGAIAYAKGGAMLKEAARIARAERLPIRFVVIGELAAEFRDPSIAVTGRYVRTELPDLVEQQAVDMVWFASVWPETFSYVTEEAMDMGLPIACFDLGAPAERVRGYAKGLVIARVDARAALDAMLGWEQRQRKATTAIP